MSTEDTQREALEATIAGLQAVIETIVAEAAEMGVSPYLLKTPHGDFLMAGPMAALAQAQAALMVRWRH